MPELYPFLLVPEFQERVWGARDLSPIYPLYRVGDQPIGEAWLTGDDCRVAGGPLVGTPLAELCRRYGRDLVGSAAPEPGRFPLLIKFLFPRDKLSVQVHPDDDTARRAGLPCGKTECWYVLNAMPGAQVALGLKPGTTRAQFEQAIRETRAEELLNWIDIHPGELLYVEAGTVHAIGPGSILVETQQNSDTTYRLYDYGRPRALHVREGLAAVKEVTRSGRVERKQIDDNWWQLVTSPCFLVEKYRGTAKKKPKEGESLSGVLFSHNTPEWNSAEIVVGLEGAGVVEAEGHPSVTFTRGDAVVIPACVENFGVRPQWTVEYLIVTLPPRQETSTELEESPAAEVRRK